MGYKQNDEITLTFGGLKSAQNEAFQDGIQFAASQLHRFFSDNPDTQKLYEFLLLISDSKLYSETDEEECSCDSDCGVEGCGQ